MSFPQRTKWLKRPIGWLDLGKSFHLTAMCETCPYLPMLYRQTALHIGVENQDIFRFCPYCLIKL